MRCRTLVFAYVVKQDSTPHMHAHTHTHTHTHTITLVTTHKCYNTAQLENVRFKVLTAASMKFRFVFWVVLPCKIIVDNNLHGSTLHPRTQIWTVRKLFYVLFCWFLLMLSVSGVGMYFNWQCSESHALKFMNECGDDYIALCGTTPITSFKRYNGVTKW
jgi:hypothetical protein